MRVGIVGTFDLANFGDLLFPVLAEEALSRRLPALELRRYSYRPMSRAAWPYDVRPLADLPRDMPALDLLIVGGGHLLRFDHPLAPGYEPTDTSAHDPTGLWLTPTLLAPMHGVPVVWNALGAWGDRPEWSHRLVAAALTGAARVAVRDRVSAEWLSDFRAEADIRIVPDSGFGAARLVRKEPTQAWSGFLERCGIDGPYVVVQPSHALIGHTAAVQQVVGEALDSGRAVLELPISPVLGDRDGLLGLDGRIRAAREWPDPALMTEIISRSDGVIAQSMHLSIVALSGGVPVFRPRSPAHLKTRVLEDFAGVHALDEIDRDVRLGRAAIDTDARERAAQVERHWDDVAELAGRRDPAVATAGRLLTELPSLLAQRAAREENLRDELAAVRLEAEAARRESADWKTRFEILRQRRAVRIALRLAAVRPRRGGRG